MARIDGVSPRHARLSERIIFRFARRSLTKLTGRDPERMLEPLLIYALSPGLMRAYGRLEQATGKLRRVDRRLMALAELKAATMTHCAYCIDIGSQVSRRWGLSDAEMLALPAYQTSALFNELDRLVLDYSVAMTRTPVAVTDELVDRLRRHLNDRQLVELTHAVAIENLRCRFNHALGIGAAGFSEGMVCALPETAPSGS